jgi:hypothetical protein
MFFFPKSPPPNKMFIYEGKTYTTIERALKMGKKVMSVRLRFKMQEVKLDYFCCITYKLFWLWYGPIELRSKTHTHKMRYRFILWIS